ncbi:putative mitochondrial nitroreductase-like protein [Leptomonas pyrrhocoris]|uniref:Putative mitochondrial nitroreductase-like protein n=1 Tax=Leptomonas pyrrhocoris TaxID=157538 RepID=A0A0M9G278_LEPPY|nr:putative mitochondrial nitroreductase-like protein [Leptomonas pyrrhocoris]KPA80845.1 putative mitochondrial nitroreductase-like protein [Leptomonas pyrrhocoris]|eukprot:XP_015659284.1 putative mitochondrial nitroreductase-like protein [Leptomonas pyrrhocoris]
MLRQCCWLRVASDAAAAGGGAKQKQDSFFSLLRRLMAWNSSNAAAADAAAASSSSSVAPTTVNSDIKNNSNNNNNGTTPTAFEAVEASVLTRWTCRHFDKAQPIDMKKLERVLAATTRAPTGFNLQGWYAIVVTEMPVRERLFQAALGQPQVLDAPATVVFVGDTEPECNAPQALEMGLETGYYGPLYGAAYLRNIYYFMHGGPMQTVAAAKSVLSTWYSQVTGTPVISAPVSRAGYAWKQTMIPATTFMQLATAAGWDTCMMEGIDEEAVKRVLGVPARCTVPVLISVGHATAAAAERAKVRSSRFATAHLIRWNKF